jgi:hypothetical protein
MEKYIDEIIQHGTDDDMHCLKKMLIKSLHEVEEHNPDMYKEFEMKLYVLANGEVLTDKIKDEWVAHMEPKAKWTKTEVESVIASRNILVPVSSAYVIMNMLYSDFKDVLGSGDDSSINNYVNAMKLWYCDIDAEHSGEQKLFKYYYNVVK